MRSFVLDYFYFLNQVLLGKGKEGETGKKEEGLVFSKSKELILRNIKGLSTECPFKA